MFYSDLFHSVLVMHVSGRIFHFTYLNFDIEEWGIIWGLHSSKFYWRMEMIDFLKEHIIKYSLLCGQMVECCMCISSISRLSMERCTYEGGHLCFCTIGIEIGVCGGEGTGPFFLWNFIVHHSHIGLRMLYIHTFCLTNCALPLKKSFLRLCMPVPFFCNSAHYRMFF